MYDKAVKQWTKMKGILQTVDETLAKHKDIAVLTMDIGEIIRGLFKIENPDNTMMNTRNRNDYFVLDGAQPLRAFCPEALYGKLLYAVNGAWYKVIPPKGNPLV
jgi:hypothetical protein